MSVAYFEDQRREMVAAIRVIARHLVAEIGKTALDDRVLKAMAKVPRHEFVPIEVQPYAYLNRPLPIGFDKTISQPLMVAVMTDLLELKAEDAVLEIGTGLPAIDAELMWVPAWASRSAARSSKPMVGGFGRQGASRVLCFSLRSRDFRRIVITSISLFGPELVCSEKRSTSGGA
jgi:hypothetical protein